MTLNKSYPSLSISKSVDIIPEALSVYINQLVYDLRRQKRDITALSLGEAYFDIPRFPFDKLDFEKGYHYSDSQGIPELRDKIAEFYNKQYGTNVDGKENVLISAGSKPIIFMCMLAVLNPGDEVLIHEPAWLSYQEQVRLCNGKVRFIPYNENIQNFGRYFTPHTKLMIINNPNNPSGRIYDEDELLEIYHACRSRSAYLMVDEAYSDYILDDIFPSMPRLVPELDGIITINSLSKNMGMSGWRVGYAIATPFFISVLLKLNQHLITCGPTILLQYLARYFDDILRITLPQVREVVEKRKRISKHLDDNEIVHLPGSSTFYFFLDLSEYQGDVMNLALYMLLEHDVALVPGSAYGKSTEKFLRMSIGTESEERIFRALQCLKTSIKKKHDSKLIQIELQRLNLSIFER
jgi:aspartate/methionine/tyrosine aminotransferase